MLDTTKSNISSKSQSRENILSWSFWLGESDTRCLSVFRILLALLMLKDALYHLPLARVFYSDEGVIPRRELFDGLVRIQRFSLMDAMGQPWIVILFFTVWIIVLIGLTVGYRTRLMAILNFIIILSVHERNGYILTSADTLMRAMSFWMMFAPIGQYYSVDAVRRRWQRFRQTGETEQLRVESEARTAFALPMRIIQMQLVIVYISTAIIKTVGSIWQDGETMHYITQIRTFALPFNNWMSTWSPELLKLASYFSLYAEIAIPILLLSPLLWRWSRGLAFILALMLHGGIAISLSIQDFSILMLICYVPFFDPAWITWLEHRLKGALQQVSLPIPFDPSSPLWVMFSLTSEDQVKLIDPSQLVEHADEWSIEKDGEAIQGQSAWLQISNHMFVAPLWSWILNFTATRTFLWHLMSITVNHYRGKHDYSKEETRDMWLRKRLLLTTVLVPMFILLIMFNIESTARYVDTSEDGFQFPAPIQAIWNVTDDVIWYTGLWQSWDMFSPTPIQYDGWLIIAGQFEDGTSYDLVTGNPVDYDTPTRWYWGPDMRWEKFEENVFQGQREPLLSGWGSYYCREFQDEPEGSRLATLQITMVFTNFYPPNGEPFPQQRDQLWNHWCYSEYAPE